MNAKSQSDIDYYYDHLKRIYLIRKQSFNFYLKNINYVKSLSGKSLLPVPLNKRVIDIIDRFCKLGDDINDYIKKGTYTTVEDLRSIYFILNSIEEFLKDSAFSLDEDMSYLIKRLNSDDFSRVDSALKILSSYTDEDYKKDLKKLELIERHISYMLR
jgi:hypothetical protein